MNSGQDQTSLRTLVIHYHLFKNAGTSIDEMLRQNFGSRWTEKEFVGPPHIRHRPVRDFVRDHTDICALSSHTALLPPPRITGVEIIPIIFVRHPIDRLRSAYEFERTQNVDTGGTRLAQEHDLAGYISGLLANKNYREPRNFQTYRLAFNTPEAFGTEIERARRAIRKLPFVGLVEAYEKSIAALELLLSGRFPGFKAAVHHLNTSPERDNGLKERLTWVKRALGKELYHTLCLANADDLLIYSLLRQRYLAS